MENGSLDGSSTPPAGEQRSVNINTTESRKIQQLLTEDLAKCRYHDQVRLPALNLLHGFQITHPTRLDEWQPEFKGEGFYWWGG